MSIVVATDFSDSARVAADVGARIAKALDEPLILVHAQEHGDDGGVRARARLAEEVDRVADFGPRQCEAMLRSGPIVPALRAAVEALAPRIVIVGAQGAAVRGVLGTVASALAARVPSPVLVVRDGARLVRFFDEQKTLRALLPYALDASSQAARDAFIEVARLGKVQGIVAHFSFPPAGQGPLASDVRSFLARDVKESLGDVPGAHIVVRDSYGALDGHICDLAGEMDVDLIVVGTHQRRHVDWVTEGSIAGGVLKHAPVSVLVAPLVR